MSISNRIILFSFLLIGLVIFSCNDEKSNYQSVNQSAIEYQIDSIVKPFISDSLIAGTVVGVAHKGEVKLIKSYGFSDLNKKNSLEKNAVFPIASVSKTFTAIAIMQLVEKGQINLDDNIEKFIDFDTKGNVITVRELLNHTSGIKDYTESDIPSKLQKIGYSSENLLQLLEEKEFDFKPGEAMDYNNSGYYLLAIIIEKVSGLSYQQFLNDNIFQPVSMTSTANCYSLTGNLIVNGYNLSREGNLNAAEVLDFQMATGAGSICSTVEDLLNWQIAFHKSNELLEKNSYNTMITANKLQNGGFTKYGLGIEINQYNGNEVFSHNGVIEGYLSDMRYFPESDLIIVTLINTLGKIKPMNVSNTIADYFIQNKNVAKSYDGNIEELSGSYIGLVMGIKIQMSVFEENGKLFIESRGNKFQIQFIGQNMWLAEDGYTYTFIENKMQVNDPKVSIIFNKEE
ncbi:serine hydrolase domain-containing protein [Aquiflexum lacus]|uniref:serine hydrolase domain-containing protein n=1 Tax=Aquiflexum lacus TaxID=2483805 RepID=UPI0018931747|nr:serine hydrolase domain-containing protein [Aquiflexum lacus]